MPLHYSVEGAEGVPPTSDQRLTDLDERVRALEIDHRTFAATIGDTIQDKANEAFFDVHRRLVDADKDLRDFLSAEFAADLGWRVAGVGLLIAGIILAGAGSVVAALAG